MMQIRFDAPDYHADGSFSISSYEFEGSQDAGWKLQRNGESYLQLGPGYRPLQTLACGVCSTDLARQFLPFPLPQVTGHELVARDEAGQRYVVEINSSCRARGADSECAFCRNGLERHCPERIVLGIHDLPGGFGPWILAPQDAVIAIQDALSTRTALLIEPFAAALHGVARVAPRAGERVAVLGPRRLGMLTIAALAGFRERSGIDFEITALARRQPLVDLAVELGADEGIVVVGQGESLESESHDVVFDTTGTSDGFELAIRLARRELHLKSTHGQPASGLSHLTELVVDELSIAPMPDQGSIVARSASCLGWLSSKSPPRLPESVVVHAGTDSARMLHDIETHSEADAIPRVDAAVVDSAQQVDSVIRPDPEREVSLVRPRGEIWIHPDAELGDSSSLLSAVQSRGLRLSSSRCGDFHEALTMLVESPSLRELGERVMTHGFPAEEVAQAFEVAASPGCIKAYVSHVGFDGSLAKEERSGKGGAQ